MQSNGYVKNIPQNPLRNHLSGSLNDVDRNQWLGNCYDQRQLAHFSSANINNMSAPNRNMSGIEQTEQPLWVYPMDNMYAETHDPLQGQSSHTNIHESHETMEQNHNQMHVAASHSRHHEISLQHQPSVDGNPDGSGNVVNENQTHYFTQVQQQAQQQQVQQQAQTTAASMDVNSQGQKKIDNSKRQIQKERAERKRIRERQRREDVNRLF